MEDFGREDEIVTQGLAGVFTSVVHANDTLALLFDCWERYIHERVSDGGLVGQNTYICCRTSNHATHLRTIQVAAAQVIDCAWNN